MIPYWTSAPETNQQLPEGKFAIKRKLYAYLPQMAELADELKCEFRDAVAIFVDELVRAGYAQSLAHSGL